MILLVLFPWASEIMLRVGRWIWTTTNSGITQYDGFNPHADGSSDQDFIAAMPELAAMSEVKRSDYLSHLAHQFITEHPETAIALAIRQNRPDMEPDPAQPRIWRDEHLCYRRGFLQYSLRSARACRAVPR